MSNAFMGLHFPFDASCGRSLFATFAFLRQRGEQNRKSAQERPVNDQEGVTHVDQPCLCRYGDTGADDSQYSADVDQIPCLPFASGCQESPLQFAVDEPDDRPDLFFIEVVSFKIPSDLRDLEVRVFDLLQVIGYYPGAVCHMGYRRDGHYLGVGSNRHVRLEFLFIANHHRATRQVVDGSPFRIEMNCHKRKPTQQAFGKPPDICV